MTTCLTQITQIPLQLSRPYRLLNLISGFYDVSNSGVFQTPAIRKNSFASVGERKVRRDSEGMGTAKIGKYETELICVLRIGFPSI